MSRILKLLRSLITRQSQRLDLSLVRAGIILATLAGGANYHFVSSAGIGQLTGAYCLYWFYPLSLFALAYLAGRLNGEIAGDASTGLLSLIAMTGTTNTEWTLLRVLQNWTNFLSVWMIRLPFLLLFFTLGGVNSLEMLGWELLFLLVFSATSSRSMLRAHDAESSKVVVWTGIGTIFQMELVLSLGRIFTTIGKLLGLSLPTWVNSIAFSLSELTLLSHFTRFVSGIPFGPQLGLTLLLYLGLSLYWTALYRRHLYDRIGESPEPIVESVKEKAKALRGRPPLERCWDNAIAWQLYTYYEGGSDNTLGRSILYTLAFLFVCFCVATNLLESMMGIVLVGSGIIFLNAMNAPSRSFDKEVKAKTLASLVLTPHSTLDLYRGYRRGTFRLATPDHIFMILVAAVMSFVHPAIPLIIVSVLIAVDLSGPLLFLSGLVHLTLKGLNMSFLVLLGLGLVVTAGALAGNFIHPAAFPVAAIPVYWGFNFILLHYFLDRWMKNKIDAEV